jgi:hypothetical protein
MQNGKKYAIKIILCTDKIGFPEELGTGVGAKWIAWT